MQSESILISKLRMFNNLRLFNLIRQIRVERKLGVEPIFHILDELAGQQLFLVPVFFALPLFLLALSLIIELSEPHFL